MQRLDAPDLSGGDFDARIRDLRLVARGARGQLLRGEWRDGSGPVAVKVVYATREQAQEEFELQFEREARQAAAIHDPHVLAVYDHGHASARAMYMECEWLEGCDLARSLQANGVLAERLALQVALQACAGLRAAHGLGIVHGDLAPSSLFLHRSDAELVVKLMDFGRHGLEQWVDESDGPASLPQGWACYRSPEQIRGAELDERADIYALGAILYQALSGELPFDDVTGIGILIALSTREVVPLRARRAARAVSSGMERLVMRCLQPGRSQRFGSARELGEALEALK